MSIPSKDDARLRAAVEAIWQEWGPVPGDGAGIETATALYRQALAAGRAIPRTTDKTLAPLFGPRRDIEIIAKQGDLT